MDVFWFIFGTVSVSFALGVLLGYKFRDYKLEEDLWEQDAG